MKTSTIGSWKRIWRSQAMQRMLGSMLAFYIRLIGRTTTFVEEPRGILDDIRQHDPFIAAMWHGQHFMIPLALRPSMRFATLISRHGDGEINAIAAGKLGIGLVRGSGGQTAEEVSRRGGAQALRVMLTTLQSGTSLCFTADVPKVARLCGMGIVTLARMSGRPIVPVAVVTRRRIAFSSWDRASIGLPFNRGAIVLGDPVFVDRNADQATLEAARLSVESGLDQVHRRAYQLVGGTDPGADNPQVIRNRATNTARPDETAGT